MLARVKFNFNFESNNNNNQINSHMHTDLRQNMDCKKFDESGVKLRNELHHISERYKVDE